MWRKIWDGPFYIGRLSRPVSVGDAIIKVLETLWRASIILITIVLLLLSVYYIQYRYSKWKDDLAIKNVYAFTSISDLCDVGEFAVTIKNRNDFPIKNVSYDVEMTLGGHDVTPRHLRDIWYFRSISGGHQLVKCHAAARDEYGRETGYRTQKGTVVGVTVRRVKAE